MLPPAPGRFSITNGLADPLRQPLRHQPGEDVGAAAGGEADDDADRLRRIGLRRRRARSDRERGRARGQMQKPTAMKLHGVPSTICAVPWRAMQRDTERG